MQSTYPFGGHSNATDRARVSAWRPWRRGNGPLVAAVILLVPLLGYYYLVYRAHAPTPYVASVTKPYAKRGMFHISTMACHGSDRLWAVRVNGDAGASPANSR